MLQRKEGICVFFRSCHDVISSLPILKYTIKHLHAKRRRCDCNFDAQHPTKQHLDPSLRKESWTKFSCKILMYLFDNVGRWLENEMDIRAYRNVYATSTLQGIDREQKGIWKLQSLVDASWFSQFFGDTCVRFKLHGVTDGACVLHLKECKLGSENVFVRGCAGCTNHCVETVGMESVTTKEDNHSGRWFPGILGKKIPLVYKVIYF